MPAHRLQGGGHLMEGGVRRRGHQAGRQQSGGDTQPLARTSGGELLFILDLLAGEGGWGGAG